MTTEPHITVLVADGDPATRDKVRRALSVDSAFEICAEADDAPSAIEMAVSLLPSICLLDVGMPGSGLAAVWEIRARCPLTRIVMLAASDSADDLLAAVRAGADGYLLTSSGFERISATLRGLLAGEAAISRRLVSTMMEHLRDYDPRPRRVEHVDGYRFTSREWQVLQLLAQELPTSQIARRLTISESAVRSHVASVTKKMNVHTRAQAVALFKARAEPDQV